MWVRITLLSLQMWYLLQTSSSLTFRQTTECGFTLKLVRDVIITYSQMLSTDKYSQHSSIIWHVWLNGWVFVFELSGCRFESRCCQLKLHTWFLQIYLERASTSSFSQEFCRMFQSSFYQNNHELLPISRGNGLKQQVRKKAKFISSYAIIWADT